MTGKVLSFLLFFSMVASMTLQAGGPLPVLYPEDDDQDNTVGESQQGYIDNQAYLREFERQRTTRVLGSSSYQAPVAVIRRSSERSRTISPFNYPFYKNYESNSFFGVELKGGATTIRYFDGYRPNCCGSRYYVRPRRPVAVPYR